MNVVLAYEPSADHLARMQSLGSVSLEVVRDEHHARELMATAEAWLGNLYFLQSVATATRLRWMQSASMGVDLLLRDLRAPDFVITTAQGCYEDEVADHALALVMGCLRRLDVWENQRRAGRFSRRSLGHLRDSEVVVIGFGGIGRGVAARLRACGAIVHAVRRTGSAGEPTGYGGCYLLRDELPHALVRASVVVVALPLTRDTEEYFSADLIAALRPGAVVVNVGRGATVDEAALVDAADRGRIVAGLDVYRDEPLPAGHPLWRTENMLVTPHVGRSLEAGPGRRFESLFEENLGRFVRGESLRNVVDVARGY